MNVTLPKGAAEVTVAELRAALDNNEDIILLDVRTQGEFEQARVAETFAMIPYDEVPDRLDQLPENKDAFIYLICRSGRRSGIATNALRSLGYRNTYNVIGGMNAWSSAGYEIASGPVPSER